MWHEEVERVAGRVVGVVKRVDAAPAIGDVRCCRGVQNSLPANGDIRGARQPDNEDFFRTRSDTSFCQQVTLAIDRHGRVCPDSIGRPFRVVEQPTHHIELEAIPSRDRGQRRFGRLERLRSAVGSAR